MGFSIGTKSDCQAKPDDLQRFGAALRAAQPKAPASGIVALGFSEPGTPLDGIDLATAFLLTCRGQAVKFEQLPAYEQDSQTISNIWNLGGGQGTVMIFYLPDMTRLADIDVAAANKSWGRNLQHAVIKAKIDLTAGPV